MQQTKIEIETPGRGLIDITAQVQACIAKAEGQTGLCNIYVPHTSASLLLNENWDADVQRDLEAFFARLVPDGDPLFVHTSEGPDDMPAHIRTALTQTSITIPIVGGQLATGTWQGLFLWEHRIAPHRRKLIVTISGD